MKQQESVETPGDIQEEVIKRQPIEKKRKIRKEKIQQSHVIINYNDVWSIDTKKLTKEERAKVQKVKNRQAAQKSRDTHKQYVLKLEEEVKELRQFKENSRNICWKCKKQIQDNQNNYHSQNSLKQNNFGVETTNLLFDDSNINQVLQLPVLNSNRNLFDEDSFMRVEESSQSYPYFKPSLFIIALIAIICVSTFYKPSSSSRALMEVHTQGNQIQGLSTDTLRKMQERFKFQKENDENVNKTAVVKVESIQEHGLIALNNDCIKSLMKIQEPVPVQNSLTSYSDPTYNQKNNHMNQNEGILLCHLRQPKPYTPKIQQYRPPLVRLFLLGSQIKDLITNFKLMIPVLDGDTIQTNGIYQVLANIKQVNKVTNHNCLL